MKSFPKRSYKTLLWFPLNSLNREIINKYYNKQKLLFCQEVKMLHLFSFCLLNILIFERANKWYIELYYINTSKRHRIEQTLDYKSYTLPIEMIGRVWNQDTSNNQNKWNLTCFLLEISEIEMYQKHYENILPFRKVQKIILQH